MRRYFADDVHIVLSAAEHDDIYVAAAAVVMAFALFPFATVELLAPSAWYAQFELAPLEQWARSNGYLESFTISGLPPEYVLCPPPHTTSDLSCQVALSASVPTLPTLSFLVLPRFTEYAPLLAILAIPLSLI